MNKELLKAKRFRKTKYDSINKANVKNFLKEIGKTEQIRLVKLLKLNSVQDLLNVPVKDLLKSLKQIYKGTVIVDDKYYESQADEDDDFVSAEEDEESKYDDPLNEEDFEDDLNDEIDSDPDTALLNSSVKTFSSLPLTLLSKKLEKNDEDTTEYNSYGEAKQVYIEKLVSLIQENEKEYDMTKPKVEDDEKLDVPFFNSDEFYEGLSSLLPENVECINKLKEKPIETDFSESKCTDIKKSSILAYHYLSFVQKYLSDDCKVVSQILHIENVQIENIGEVFKDKAYVLFTCDKNKKVLCVVDVNGNLKYESCTNCFKDIQKSDQCCSVLLVIDEIDQRIINSLPILFAIQKYLLDTVSCIEVDNQSIIDFYEHTLANGFLTSLTTKTGAFIGLESFEYQDTDTLKLAFSRLLSFHELPVIIGGENYSMVWAPMEGTVHTVKVNGNFGKMTKNYIECVYVKCMTVNSLARLKFDMLCNYYVKNSTKKDKVKRTCIDENEIQDLNYLNLGDKLMRKVLNKIDTDTNEDINSEAYEIYKDNLNNYFT